MKKIDSINYFCSFLTLIIVIFIAFDEGMDATVRKSTFECEHNYIFIKPKDHVVAELQVTKNHANCRSQTD